MRTTEGVTVTGTPSGPARAAATDLCRVALQHWGLVVLDLRDLGGETDRTVKLTTEGGQSYVLKISDGTATQPELVWQVSILSHLAASAPDLPMPRLVPALSGADLVQLSFDGHPVVARLLTWLPGSMLVDLEHHSPELLTELGRMAGRLTLALSDIDVPSIVPAHHWDIRLAAAAIESCLPYVADPDNRLNVERVLDWSNATVPTLDRLPMGVVHHDINDFNVLVDQQSTGEQIVTGIVDVGDALPTVRVAEIAIAVAYAMLRKADPLTAACAVVDGFHSVAPLTEAEIAVIFPLAAARLCVNATTWTRRIAEHGTSYGARRMRHTWPTIAQLVSIGPGVARAALRRVCGLEPSAAAAELRERWEFRIPRHRPTTPWRDADRPVVELDTRPVADLYDGVNWLDKAAVRRSLVDAVPDRAAAVGVTRHLQPSLLRAARRQPGLGEPATLQLGVGLLLDPGETVVAPSRTVVEPPTSADIVILRHDSAGDGSLQPFWSCWWGIDATAAPGTVVSSGEALGTVAVGGTTGSNSSIHGFVQVQVFADRDLALGRPPRWVREGERELWQAVSPDPSHLLGLPPTRMALHLDTTDVLALRDRRLARSQRSYYRRPMNLTRGSGVWLVDDRGRMYLDAINNVTHIGHSEPRLSAAVTRQMGRLNTNSRFLYEGMARYAERLTATLPDGLDVVFLVCTGSEANDLALRMTRQVTGRQDMLVIDGAYHGNTAAVTGVSPNRYKGRGGQGRPSTTHEVPTPDRYRGRYGYDDADAGERYARNVADIVRHLDVEGRPPAGFIAESLMGTAGSVVLPPGYLQPAFQAVRDSGGLCISDEVQVGMGRLGDVFWGFQAQGVVPDIVTMGKPLGNGYPLAAVVTTREIADAFDNGAKYFNTFGGSPLACAVGETVLQIVVDDNLQQRAGEVGDYFLHRLGELAARHQCIGDVRGHGLYLGIDLVTDRHSRTPATALAMAVAEGMKDEGVITYPTGAADNVLKVKPPMVFGEDHVDLFVDTLDAVLSGSISNGGDKS